VVAGISAELYGTRDDIAANLKEHVRSLKKANEDIRILSVKYILELLESKTQNEIRIVLVSKDVLKVVYRNILEMK
jgi:predicted ribonuclease YlaK